MRYRLYSRLGLNAAPSPVFFLKHYHQLVGPFCWAGDIHGRSGEAAAALVHQPDHSAHYRRVMLILTLAICSAARSPNAVT